MDHPVCAGDYSSGMETTTAAKRLLPEVAKQRSAKRLTDPEMQGIARDQRLAKPSDAGWRVRLMKAGTYVANRHFRDEAYGNKEKSLRAARNYRDDMALQNGIRLRLRRDSPLAVLRSNAGISQTTLAAWLNVSPGQIVNWEQGSAPGMVLTLIKGLLNGSVRPYSPRFRELNLRDFRMKMGLSQSEMAKMFERGYATVGEWERGGRRVPGWVLVYANAIRDGWLPFTPAGGGPVSALKDD